jgi:hypothetical protein
MGSAFGYAEREEAKPALAAHPVEAEGKKSLGDFP